MKCPNSQCGAENADGARFCRSCGTDLSSEQPTAAAGADAAAKTCPACHRSVPAQARFCGKCGCPISSEPDEPSSFPDAFLPLDTPTVPFEREPIVDVDATIIRPPPRAPQPIAPEVAETGSGEVGQSTTPERPNGRYAPTGNGRLAKPLPLAAIGIAAVLAGALGTWLLLGQTSSIPTSNPAPVKAVEPATPATPAPPLALPAPAPEPAPITTAPPADSAVPPAGTEPVAKPFLPLLTPEPEPQRPRDSVRSDEARAKAERARKREEARLAREAVIQQAREAALRNSEAASAPTRPSSPDEICADQSSFMARNSCLTRLCQQSEWMYHSVCVKRREHEEQKRQGSFQTN